MPFLSKVERDYILSVVKIEPGCQCRWCASIRLDLANFQVFSEEELARLGNAYALDVGDLSGSREGNT